MKVAVIGKGRSGQAAYQLLEVQGKQPYFLDDADGNLTAEQILKAERVILSPGVPRAHPAIQAAIQAGLPIDNEIDLAFEHLELLGAKFVGITGSNGKSTAVSLLGEIVRLHQPSVFVGGNLGRPLCEAVLVGESPKIVILELSSYQLETLNKLRLDHAALLNLSPDHLDRYPSVEDYYAAKRRIFSLVRNPKGVNDTCHSALDAGSMDASLRWHDKVTVIARELGIPENLIQQGLKNFKGLPHRLEILGEKNGVTYINDSKATNVASALHAIRKFESGVHWILGGVGKGAPYDELVKEAAKRAKAVYLIGAEATKIKSAFAVMPAKAGIHQAHTLQNAFELASKTAKPSDIVLLSPACASFDQFKNFESRGDLFRSLFHAL